jgi:nucleotide-binding universal stress UspA family protein
MTVLQAPQRAPETAFGTVLIASTSAEARDVLSVTVDELLPLAAERVELSTEDQSERAAAQHVRRSAEECGADVVVMTASEAGIAARRLLAYGSAVLAVPPAWWSAAGLKRIAVGYDGSEPAEAALEATCSLVEQHHGGVPRVELVHVDDSASAANELDTDIVNARRVAVIEWWLAEVARRVPAPVGVVRRIGDPVSALVELSSDVELLVVGTHGRGSLRRIVGGSIFAELIDRAGCPLLIVPGSWRGGSASTT